MATRVPNPAYPAKDSAVLYGNKEIYERIRKVADQEGGKTLVEEFEIPIRSGKAWIVKKGEFCKSFYGGIVCERRHHMTFSLLTPYISALY
jgi:hypothetical protein